MIVARMKGGIGNQLFCYSAARRLSLSAGAELVIDAVSGFERDFRYQRRYALDNFELPVRKATARERLEPFARYRRGIAKVLSRRAEWSRRSYIEQDGLDFDVRLLELEIDRKVYLDGWWQSEGYFKDVEETIRSDLSMPRPVGFVDQQLEGDIHNGTAVAVHVRWFDPPGAPSVANLPVSYYREALDIIRNRVDSPTIVLFSDNIEPAQALLAPILGQTPIIVASSIDRSGYTDLWLMGRCKHFVIANSTFSWWGAWLSAEDEKIVIAPREGSSERNAWGFEGLLPPEWLRL